MTYVVTVKFPNNYYDKTYDYYSEKPVFTDGWVVVGTMKSPSLAQVVDWFEVGSIAERPHKATVWVIDVVDMSSEYIRLEREKALKEKKKKFEALRKELKDAVFKKTEMEMFEKLRHDPNYVFKVREYEQLSEELK